MPKYTLDAVKALRRFQPPQRLDSIERVFRHFTALMTHHVLDCWMPKAFQHDHVPNSRFWCVTLSCAGYSMRLILWTIAVVGIVQRSSGIRCLSFPNLKALFRG
jgi:hypothetical protein